MPLEELLVFRNESGNIPFKEWRDELRKTERRAYAKCQDLIRALVQYGNLLKPPRAKALNDGIWELRARSGKVRYEIEAAIGRLKLVLKDPEQYTASWEVE